MNVVRLKPVLLYSSLRFIRSVDTDFHSPHECPFVGRRLANFCRNTQRLVNRINSVFVSASVLNLKFTLFDSMSLPLAIVFEAQLLEVAD